MQYKIETNTLVRSTVLSILPVAVLLKILVNPAIKTVECAFWLRMTTLQAAFWPLLVICTLITKSPSNYANARCGEKRRTNADACVGKRRRENVIRSDCSQWKPILNDAPFCPIQSSNVRLGKTLATPTLTAPSSLLATFPGIYSFLKQLCCLTDLAVEKHI